MTSTKRPDATTPRVLIPMAQTPTSFPVRYVWTQMADEVHRLSCVLRLDAGASLILVDIARGQAYRGILLAAHGDNLEVDLHGLADVAATNCGAPRVLVAALLKAPRWELLLEKATELGASHIVPVQATRSVVQVKDTEAKRQRWQGIAERAARQCEALQLPQILDPVTIGPALDNSLEAISPGINRWLLAEWGEDRQPLAQAAQQLAPEQGVAMAIGPEGGWTPEEMQSLQALGFQPIMLGPRLLRAETAAMVALGGLLVLQPEPAAV